MLVELLVIATMESDRLVRVIISVATPVNNRMACTCLAPKIGPEINIDLIYVSKFHYNYYC